jgi:hypothetical protein
MGEVMGLFGTGLGLHAPGEGTLDEEADHGVRLVGRGWGGWVIMRRNRG